MKPWESTVGILLACLAAEPELQAQLLSVGGATLSTADTIVQFVAKSDGLALVPPEALPSTGTFWVMSANGAAPPMPSLRSCDPGAAVYDITSNAFVEDARDRQVKHLAVTRTAVASKILFDQMESATTHTQTALPNQQMQAINMMAASDSNGRLAPAFDFPTNLLYLQITGVVDGAACLILNNATDQVYAAWSTTNLSTPFTNWQVEVEVWPTNGTVMPWRVVMSGRDTLFLRAEDWTGVDANSNSIPDWWEWKYFANFNEPPSGDYDGDGINNSEEYLNSTDPTNPDSLPGLLARWHFDTTDWLGAQCQAPLLATNLDLVPSWSGNGVELNTADGNLLYNVVEADGHTNLNLQRGTIRFWFSPNWSSVSQGGAGAGPYNWPALFEVDASDSSGYWELYIDPYGTNLWFDSSEGASWSEFMAPISWRSNQWNQVAITYTSSNSAMYIDGVLTAGASGIATLTSPSGTLYVGNDVYACPAYGKFDELDTFDYPLTAERIASGYHTVITQDKNGNGLPDFWVWRNFGHMGVDPNADPDGDGFSNLQEYQMETDPNAVNSNIITFSFSVPSQHVGTNILNGVATVSGGVPFYFSVLVDSTDFSNATWTAYTSSNITVNIGANQGWHDVWIGLRGFPASSQPTWQDTSVILEYVQLEAAPIAGFPPLTVTFQVATNTAPGTVQSVMYDFNGDGVSDFTTNNLDAITYIYASHGKYFPAVTIQTDEGTFSSSGEWNATDPNRLQILVQNPAIQLSTINVTDPVDIKWVAPGNLYVLSGSTATLTEFDTNGSAIRSLSNLGSNPSSFDVDAAGNVYMALKGGNQVWKFNPTTSSFAADTNFGFDGFIGKTNGAAGSDTNEFKAPFDVAVSPDGGTISVSDSGNDRIQQFSTNGTFIAAFGSQGSDVGEFNMPKGLTYDKAGNLYIADSGNNRIVLTQGSTVIGASGTNGTGFGEFNAPVNISINDRGIYLTDTGNNRVQCFNPLLNGSYDFANFGIRFVLSTNLNQPAAIAAVNNLTNEMFYVADTGNNRVLLYGFPTDDPTPVWTNMTAHVAAGDISGAILQFASVSTNQYLQAIAAIGTNNIISAIGEIRGLTPVYIYNDQAQYYFTNTIDGQVITFPVEFVKENGVWKLLEF